MRLLLGLLLALAVSAQASALPAILPASAFASAHWLTSSAGTALSLTGFTKTFESNLTDCADIGTLNGVSQPTKHLFLYNGISFSDSVGNPIYMAPNDPAASGYSGLTSLACSGAGATITLQYDGAHSRWQSATLTTINSNLADGESCTNCYIEMTVTTPAVGATLKPNVSAWAKTVTAYLPAGQAYHDETDIYETNIRGISDCSLEYSTEYRWPDSLATVQGQVGNVTSYGTPIPGGTACTGAPIRWGMMVTPTWVRLFSNISGSMVETARFPVLSVQDKVAWYGLFDIASSFSLSGASTSETYSAILSDIQVWSCTTPSACPQ